MVYLKHGRSQAGHATLRLWFQNAPHIDAGFDRHPSPNLHAVMSSLKGSTVHIFYAMCFEGPDIPLLQYAPADTLAALLALVVQSHDFPQAQFLANT